MVNDVVNAALLRTPVKIHKKLNEEGYKKYNLNCIINIYYFKFILTYLQNYECRLV